MESVIAFLAAIVLGALGASLTLGYLFRDKWGPAGHGPFALFGGAVREERRGPPWAIVLGATALFVWAGMTMLAFAPAGLTLAIILLDQELLLALILGALCLNGFALSTGMVVSGMAVLGRNARVRAITTAVAGWSVVHHIAIFGYFMVLAYQEGPIVDVLMFVGVPCVIGGVMAAILAWSGRRAEPALSAEPRPTTEEA